VTHEHPNHKWWTLFAMCFALFMIMLDNTIVNVALPSIQHDLKPTPENLEWTVNAYILVFATLILLGGKLGDRYGRRRIFQVGLLIFTLSSAACALSQSDTQLIGFRAVQGVGGAFLNPLSLSILVAAFPRKQLPQAIGIWAGISGLGLAIGPLLGGFLTQHYSWSAVFWVNVPIGIIAMGVTAWAVVESRDPSARSLDIIGTVLISGALFALTWGLIQTASHAWLGAYTLTFLAASAVLFTLFVVWESRVPDPMIPLGFFRIRAFSVSSIVVALVGLALFGVIYFLTLYFQNVRGYDPIQAGLRTLPTTMMILFVAPIGGRLSGRVGPRWLMTVGMFSASIGLFGLSFVSIDSSYNAIWPFQILMGAGMALTMPAVSATGMAAVERTKAGIASGVINASRQVGGALGIAVLGGIGTTLAANQWAASIAGLPPALHAKAEQLIPLVQGGQGKQILAITGNPTAETEALKAFVHGVDRAFLTGAGLTFIAALVAMIGLAHLRPQTAEAEGGGQPAPEGEAAEAPPAVVEM
jgi:EmrB/QacA subfamily drug resistance transporter